MVLGVCCHIQIIMLRFLAVVLARVNFHQRGVSHSKSVGRAVALEEEAIEDGGVVEGEVEVFMMIQEWGEEGTGLIHMNNNHQRILVRAVLPRQRILGALALSPKMGHGKATMKRRVIMAICRILGIALQPGSQTRKLIMRCLRLPGPLPRIAPNLLFRSLVLSKLYLVAQIQIVDPLQLVKARAEAVFDPSLFILPRIRGHHQVPPVPRGNSPQEDSRGDLALITFL